MQYPLTRRREVGAAAPSVAVAVLMAVVFTLCAGCVLADGIMLQVSDAPLKQVIMLLVQQSGANIVIADETKLDRKVTASLQDVPLEKALDYVVKSAGISYKKMDDGTYIIAGSAADESVVPLIDLPKDLPVLEEPEVVPPPPPKKELKVVSVKLVHSRPSELLQLLGWTGPVPAASVEVAGPGVRKPISTRQGGNVFMTTPTGKVYDMGEGVRMQNNQPVMPTIDPTGGYKGEGRAADQSTGAGQVTTTPRPSGPPGYNPYQRPGTTGQPGTTTTQPTTTTTTTSGNFLWPEGLVGDPVPFDLDNSIIIKGDEDAIEQFKRMVRMLDVPPKQVQIKAEFVEVKTTDVKRFGIDWSLQSLNESFQTQFGVAGTVLAGFTAGNLTVNMAAELTKSVGRIINAPIISTLNNQWADISITQDIPFWSSTTIITETGPVTSPYVDFIHIDSGLGVLPRVNGDGTVTMILRPRVSDTGQFVTGPQGSGTGAFETRSQYLQTQRRVANGETIVVGGFIRKNESNNYQKIPILADLPIIGGLFRTTDKQYQDSELLIFVTPTIIPETGAGTVGGTLET